MVEAIKTKQKKVTTFSGSFASASTRTSAAGSAEGAAKEESKEDDSSNYWTVSYGKAVRNGWSCRACRKGIMKGADMAIRDGRKLRLMYHKACFSGQSDPRTQPGSSFQEGRLPVFSPQAPVVKGAGKWSVNSYGYQGNDV